MHANLIQKGYFEPWTECDQSKFEGALQDTTTETRHEAFCELLGLNDLYNDQLRRDAFLEFCEKMVDICGQYDMTPLKCWTLFKIFKTFHIHCCQSNLTPIDACKLFKDILLRHSMERPPFSICIFAFRDVEPIINFMVNDYFRHYKVYLVAFSGPKRISKRRSVINTGPAPDGAAANKENENTNQENTEEQNEDLLKKTNTAVEDDEDLDSETILKNKEFEEKFSFELQSLQKIMEEKLEVQKQQFLEQISSLKGQLQEKNKSKA